MFSVHVYYHDGSQIDGRNYIVVACASVHYSGKVLAQYLSTISGIFCAGKDTRSDIGQSSHVWSSLQYLNNHESMKKYIDLYSGSGFAAIDSNGTIATSICGIFSDSSLSGFTRVRSSPNQSYHGYFIAYTDRICLYVGGCIYGYGANGIELTNVNRFGGYDNTILEPTQNGIIFSSTHNIITGVMHT